MNTCWRSPASPRPPGIINVCHSAGYINPKPLEELCPHLQAACVDLKGFTEEFYRDLVGATLAPVLETLKIFRKQGVHLEIVNLVIPQFNDNPKDLEKMCAWIRDELGPLTPLHFSRFYPLYKMKQHYPTPVSTLEKAREIALKTGLKYVYLGNIPQNPAENTYCHNCQPTHHPPPGLYGGRDEAQRGQMRLLRHRHSQVSGVSRNRLNESEKWKVIKRISVDLG